MSIIQNVKKTINYGKKNGYWEAACAALERISARYYADYRYEPPMQQELVRQQQENTGADILFSLLVPAYETQKEYLEQLIDSCLGQTYSNWELLIADASESEIVQETLAKYQDNRIRRIRLTQNEGIAGNTNQAIERACGEYCGLLDHDDLLTPDALYEMVKAIKEHTEKGEKPILLYSDEDKCDESGQRFFDPHIKLDFNLDLILTNNYICHFMAVRTTQLQKLMIRTQYDGAQDYDLVLRIVSSLLFREQDGAAKAEQAIVHIPKVLYHWRCHQDSTADNPLSKMYAYEAGRKALADFTLRMGWKADIRHNKHLGFYRIAYRNEVLQHRDDLAAVGGFVVHAGKVVSSLYRGQPLFYAGYMNRMDLYQNTNVLDIRNLAVSKAYWEVYEKVTQHPYVSTFVGDDNSTLPDWIRSLSAEQIEKLNRRLSKQLTANGARLLLDPECVRKSAQEWRRT